MPKKKKSVYTRLYELAFSFNGRAQQFFYHVEEKDRQRLLHVFGDCEEHLFHELGGHEGIERLVNSAHIRLNILDYLGGIEFEAEPKLTDRQWQKKIEEREDSDESVILRIWLKGEEDMAPRSVNKRVTKEASSSPDIDKVKQRVSFFSAFT